MHYGRNEHMYFGKVHCLALNLLHYCQTTDGIPNLKGSLLTEVLSKVIAQVTERLKMKSQIVRYEAAAKSGPKTNRQASMFDIMASLSKAVCK